MSLFNPCRPIWTNFDRSWQILPILRSFDLFLQFFSSSSNYLGFLPIERKFTNFWTCRPIETNLPCFHLFLSILTNLTHLDPLWPTLSNFESFWIFWLVLKFWLNHFGKVLFIMSKSTRQKIRQLVFLNLFSPLNSLKQIITFFRVDFLLLLF